MKQLKHHYKQAMIFIALVVLACAIPGLGDSSLAGNTSKPAVAISSPVAAQKLEVGRATTIDSTSVDTEGISRVELSINGEVIWVDANANPEPDTPFIVAQPWTPETPGTYIIQVRAYNTANVSGESESLTVEVVAVSITAEESTAIPDKSGADVIILAGTPTPTSINTITPAATNTSPPIPTRPSASPTVTATATDTPEPQSFASTGLEPEGRFNEIWLELGGGNSRLGYPTGPEIVDRNYARQHFEKGLMFWWDNPEDPDDIWVIDSPTAGFTGGATSNHYADTWPGGDEYPCPESRHGGPIRGFGKLWCDRPELQARLGYPSEPELGSGGRPPYAHVQFFQGGVMLYTPIDSEVYVLFAQGDWQRFDY